MIVGLVLLVNMSLTTRDQLVLLVLFSITSLFLLIRYHVLEEQAEWLRRRIGDPASISGVYLRGGTLFITVAIGGSLLLTNVASSDPLRGAWGGVSAGLIELSRSFQKFLPTGGNSVSFGADFDPSGTRISGRWNPDDSLEVTIQLPPGREARLLLARRHLRPVRPQRLEAERGLGGGPSGRRGAPQGHGRGPEPGRRPSR